MMNLKLWLRQQDMSVRELAAELEVPLKTVQDWVYRGVAPSPVNQEKLAGLMKCTHHWDIDTANGPASRGVCKLCQVVRWFDNSIERSVWKIQPANQPSNANGQHGGSTTLSSKGP